MTTALARLAAVIRCAMVCAVVCASCAVAGDTQSKQIVNSTVRVKVETDAGSSTIVGYGSAFGVDLCTYGVKRNRYLLSAAHLVLSDDGSRLLNGNVKVELPATSQGSPKKWVTCRVLSVTRVYDLCLLECDEEVPVVSKLTPGKDGLGVGTAVFVVGCPLGVPPQVSTGVLTDKDPHVSDRGHKVWEAAAAFNHGNSGGPVFSAAAGTVIGVAVAGVRAGGGGPLDMDPRVALFTPYYCVKHFLDVSIGKLAR
ncbi:MAG: serine protease [Planctomycetota bacterium]